MVLLELQYLYEIERISELPDVILNDLTVEVGIQILNHSLAEIIRESMTQTWTRNRFDRMITAHAIVADLELATKDQTIRKYYRQAFWK